MVKESVCWKHTWQVSLSKIKKKKGEEKHKLCEKENISVKEKEEPMKSAKTELTGYNDRVIREVWKKLGILKTV